MGLFSKKTEDKKKINEKPDVGIKTSMKDLYGDKQSIAKKDDSVSGTEKASAGKFHNAYRILMKPLVTEKASVLAAENKYFFGVYPGANKIEIAKAIKEVYGVKPIDVNIINMRGKNVRSGKTAGKRKRWKKAIITLPKGTTIKVYEGV
jgi:large subunit ribosomal protein L23